MTISFLRVLSLRSLTSSDLSMPSVNAFDAATNVKTILATSSAVVSFVTWLLPGYALALLIASNASAEPFSLVPLPTTGLCVDFGEELARRPVLRMMEPLDFESMRVDWTPALDARRERFSNVVAGWKAWSV